MHGHMHMIMCGCYSPRNFLHDMFVGIGGDVGTTYSRLNSILPIHSRHSVIFPAGIHGFNKSIRAAQINTSR